MKIIIISDTHSLHDQVKVPDGDVLIHCGDFTGGGTVRDLIAFNAWLGKLPHKHKIITAGNHDKIVQDDPNHAKILMTNATLLIDEEIIIEGKRFYASPWTPEFNDWSFMLPRGDAMKAIRSKIPDGLDVLITHGPPMGILDEVMLDGRYPSKGRLHAGCEELRSRIIEVKPKIHAFGHLHLNHGVVNLGGTVYVNASICDEAYRPIKLPVVILI
jgi:hypothetical protein